jgi:hypothetical protein
LDEKAVLHTILLELSGMQTLAAARCAGALRGKIAGARHHFNGACSLKARAANLRPRPATLPLETIKKALTYPEQQNSF